jgi:hypothetical protein
LLEVGRFCSNHSIIAFIAHTAPDDNIASKNQLIHIGAENNSSVGEKINIDINHPP